LKYLRDVIDENDLDRHMRCHYGATDGWISKDQQWIQHVTRGESGEAYEALPADIVIVRAVFSRVFPIGCGYYRRLCLSPAEEHESQRC